MPVEADDHAVGRCTLRPEVAVAQSHEAVRAHHAFEGRDAPPRPIACCTSWMVRSTRDIRAALLQP